MTVFFSNVMEIKTRARFTADKIRFLFLVDPVMKTFLPHFNTILVAGINHLFVFSAAMMCAVLFKNFVSE